MSRLFVFGCSFTNYAWPSYADLISDKFDYYENWGWPGLGNRAIAERIAECHAKNSFIETDTIIVQWSSHIRHDWFKTSTPDNKAWQTRGSIFNYLNEDTFDRKWIDTFWDEDAYFIHSINSMLLTQGLLKSCNCNWKMTTIADIKKLGNDYPEVDAYGERMTDTNNIWKKHPQLQMYKEMIFDKNLDNWITPIGLYAWQDTSTSFKFRNAKGVNKWIDYHPSAIQHSNWTTKELLPKLNLSQNLSNKALEWIDTINNIYDNSRYNFDVFCENINTDLKDWSTSYRGF